MKPLIFVHASRLESGVFGLRDGDICAAYSVAALSGEAKVATPAVSVFRHEGRLWTNGGSSSSLTFSSAHCHQLILPETKGLENAPYSYEGRTVLYKQRTYRLGPKIEFRAADRTVSEWREHLRRVYQRGGWFTSGKTYHDLLREDFEREIWDTDARAWKRISENIVAAIQLELSGPDFDKHKSQPAQPAPCDEQMELKLPTWRKRLLPV